MPVHAAPDYDHQFPLMIKNLSPNQLLLIAIAAVLLILAAFSFYLLQDPAAPLPFLPLPATSSSTPLPPIMTGTTAPTAPPPTRQTSYTPLSAFGTPFEGTPPEEPTQAETASPGATTSALAPTKTNATSPSATSVSIGTPPIITPTSTQTATTAPGTTTTPGATTSPTVTPTLSPGEFGVTGRVIQNGTPVANVVVEFTDDVTPRQAGTNPGGHYWFTTLAPGTNFTLTFRQSDNPQMIPITEIASLAWIEGTLPTGVNIIDLPDFEVSVNLNDMIFELQTPADGASYSAAAISTSNPIQFNWSLYNQGGSYQVQVGPDGSNDPIWSSNQLATTSFMWNGTVDDGTHITQGAYWWRVGVTRSLGNYIVVIFTQQFEMQFTP